MKTLKDINWGIIGCGDVTEVKSGPAFNRISHSKLVAVMRRDEVLAQDYAKRHNVPKYYSDAEKLIADTDINAVYIATPPSSHKEYALLAAEYGKPVYVEKPMAMNSSECEEMISVFQQKDLPLFVAFYRRALPRFLKVKELLERGAIGKVRFVNSVFYRGKQNDDSVEANWRINPDIAGCGYFCDLAPHSIDILQYFFGDVQDVNGMCSNQSQWYSAEDMVSYNMLFKEDVHATGIWNFNSFEEKDMNVIVGEKGKITFSTFAQTAVILETETGKEIFDIENPKHIQQPLIESIVAELRGGGTCPSSGISGAKTTDIIDKIFSKK